MRGKSDAHYRYNVTVEFEDVDGYGIVHHTRSIDYLERARVHFFLENGIDLQKIPYKLIVYTVDARFVKPAMFLDELQVEISNAKVQQALFCLTHRIRRGQALILKAKVRLAFLDSFEGAWCPVPDTFCELLEDLSQKGTS